MKEQRRGRRIALSPEERDAFLAQARTCRVATISPSGPHVSPLWFVWHDESIWLYSITSSRRFTDLQRDPRIAIVVDDGHGYEELRGVEITGTARVVGEVPRTGDHAVPVVVPSCCLPLDAGVAVTVEATTATVTAGLNRSAARCTATGRRCPPVARRRRAPGPTGGPPR